MAAGLLTGVALDALLGDPRRGHPVALFGSAAARLETATWADSRWRGVGFVAACVAPAAGLGLAGRRLGWWGVAVATWTVLGSHSLRAEARAMQRLLAAGDLPGARERVTHLVGRDPAALDAAELARAAVESVAENTCDAVVAPLFWGAVAGVPGLLGYRAVNTLDAMVGHRSPRYARFGWAAARLDDVANWVPARLGALLIAAAAPVTGGSAGAAWRVARRDGRRHPSPNSGWAEAAFAGALGLRLGGRNAYGARVETRPTLGDGRAVTVEDLPRAARLCAATTGMSAAGFALLALVKHGRKSVRSQQRFTTASRAKRRDRSRGPAAAAAAASPRSPGWLG